MCQASLPAILLITSSALQLAATERDYPIRPVPLPNVTMRSDFWDPRVTTNREVTIPYRFLYPNPLACNGRSKFNQGVLGRSPWFGCSCCQLKAGFSSGILEWRVD